jgi:hypothetical protein
LVPGLLGAAPQLVTGPAGICQLGNGDGGISVGVAVGEGAGLGDEGDGGGLDADGLGLVGETLAGTCVRDGRGECVVLGTDAGRVAG